MHPDLESQHARLLRALPAEAAPPYGYHEFERRARERAQASRGLAGGERLAAACVLAVGLAAVLVRLGAPPAPQHVSAHGTASPARLAAVPDDDVLPPQAVAAERWLASLPSEPAVVRVGTRAAVIGLQDRIAQIDDLLSGTGAEPARLAALQQERARLLGTLVQVRYAETLADGAL
jgi:hypothetical protein